MIAFLTGTIKFKYANNIIIDVNGVGYEVTVTGSLLDRIANHGSRTASNTTSSITSSITKNLGDVGTELSADDTDVKPSSVSLFVYTDVRESAICLYGFTDYAEREVFLLLRKVKGIGSKLAISILSSLNLSELLIAIGKGDSKTLIKVPGIGKRTSERMILELREQVASLVETQSEAAEHTSRPFVSTALSATARLVPQSLTGEIDVSSVRDTMLALERLGFSSNTANEALELALNSIAVRSANCASTGSQKSLATEISAGELLRLALAHMPQR